MKIAILDDYQQVVPNLKCFSLLQEHSVTVFTDTPPDTETLVTRLKDQEALVLIRERTRLTRPVLEALPNLKVISQTGRVSGHIDLEACQELGISVLEGVGSPTAPSELCWALIMAASRQIVPYAMHLQSGMWQISGQPKLGRTLKGLTLGIWGYGNIGQQIARYGQAFGMSILVWGSERARQQAERDGFLAAQSKQVFFSQADVLSLHLRLSDSTRCCVGSEDLQLMKPDALLVNISRAELIAPGALYQALTSGWLGAAALDVFEQEPASLDTEPLLNLHNVLCTPHIGYVEHNSYERYFQSAFENLVQHLKTQGA